MSISRRGRSRPGAGILRISLAFSGVAAWLALGASSWAQMCPFPPVYSGYGVPHFPAPTPAPAPAPPVPTPEPYNGPVGGGTTPPPEPYGGPAGGGSPSGPSEPAGLGGRTHPPSGAGPAAPGGSGKPAPSRAPSGGSPATPGSGRGAGPARARPKSVTSTSDWDYWWNQNAWIRFGELARDRRHRPTTGSGHNSKVPLAELPESGASVEIRILARLRVGARDGDAGLRAASLLALGKSKNAASILDLKDALMDPEPEVREAAILGLGILGRSEVIDHLGAIALSTAEASGLLGGRVPDSRAREMALFALGLLPDSRAHGILAQVAAASSTESDLPRDAATIAIAALGIHGDPTHRSLLIGILTAASRSDHERATAAVSLGRLRDRDPAAVKALLNALGAKSPLIVQGASLALGAIATPSDRNVIEALAAAIDTQRDPLARGLALLAMGSIGGPDAYQRCAAELQATGPTAGYAALATGIAAHSAGKPRELKDLLSTLSRRSGDPKVRAALALAHGLAGHQGATRELSRDLSDASTGDERAMSACSLALLAHRECVPALREALKDDDDPTFQHHAALSLALLGEGPSVTADLLRLLQSEHHPYVGAASALALGWGVQDAEISGLLDLLSSDNKKQDHRRYAAGALGIYLGRGRPDLLHRFRANNLYHLEVPTLRRVLLQL